VPNFLHCFTFAANQQLREADAHAQRTLREMLQLFAHFCGIAAAPDGSGAINPSFREAEDPFQGYLHGVLDDYDAARSVPLVANAVVAKAAEKTAFNALYYKVVRHRSEVYDIVTRAFRRIGDWEELPSGLGLGDAWNVLWTWTRPRIDWQRLLVFQKVNHFPENIHLSRKDHLKRCFDRFCQAGPRAKPFNVLPKTFVLPKDYVAFVTAFTEDADAAEVNGDANLWIMKPVGQSRGRGIRVIADHNEVQYSEPTIIQKYISNPLLLGGYKFDLRLFVLITCFHPLEAFLYQEGFARLATVKYTNDASAAENKFIHLTNSSIQRHSANSREDAGGADGQEARRDAAVGGTKIDLATLKERLKRLGHDWKPIWRRITEVVLKTLCVTQDHIPHNPNAFELFGFDVLLDTKLMPHLIEVNTSPSMARSTSSTSRSSSR
jgi:tubulin polyglutamylase TTLL5